MRDKSLWRCDENVQCISNAQFWKVCTDPFSKFGVTRLDVERMWNLEWCRDETLMKSKQSKNNDRTPQTHVFHFNIIYWICRITLENVDETFTISHGRSELTHSTHRSNIFAREVLFPFHIEFVFSSILTIWWYGTSGLEISLNQIFGKTKRLVFFPTKSEFFKWIFGLSVRGNSTQMRVTLKDVLNWFS